MHVFPCIIENFHFEKKFSHFLIEKIGFNEKIWKVFPSQEKKWTSINRNNFQGPNSQVNKKEIQHKTPNYF